MFGRRLIFAFVPVMFILVAKVSTAPILDIQLLPLKLGEWLTNGTLATTDSLVHDDENDSKESDEDDLLTTTTDLPRLVTDGLLVKENKNLTIHVDEILDLTDRLVLEFSRELPSTPTTENPEEADHDDN